MILLMTDSIICTDHVSFAQLSAGEHLGLVCLWYLTDSTSVGVSGHPSPSFSSEYGPRTGIGGSDSTSQLLEELPNSWPQLPLSHSQGLSVLTPSFPPSSLC